MVEQPAVNRFVVGSSPTRGAGSKSLRPKQLRQQFPAKVVYNDSQISVVTHDLKMSCDKIVAKSASEHDYEIANLNVLTGQRVTAPPEIAVAWR